MAKKLIALGDRINQPFYIKKGEVFTPDEKGLSEQQVAACVTKGYFSWHEEDEKSNKKPAVKS